jgi:hypothetical protein
MKLRYFVVGPRGVLHKVSGRAIQALWDGRCRAQRLGGRFGHELRVVSVACDRKLLPRKVYLLRLPLADGLFTEASYFTLQAFMRSDCITTEEMIDHHLDGWPRDFIRQLAVALDVPRAALGVPFGVGGPLLLAAAMRTTPGEAVRYLR